MATACKECGAYIGHGPRCSLIDHSEAKEQLKSYYEQWLERENTWSDRESRLQRKLTKFKDEAEKWRGKYLTVKHENNILRKRIVKHER